MVDTETELRTWKQDLDAAKKREESYRKDGERILSIYDGTKAAETPFNILFSNTETLLPAIYSATPRPLVERRFKEGDPIAKASALAGTRLLTFLVDTNVAGYETFDEGIAATTLNALLPGRGELRIKYDADLSEPTATAAAETTEEATESEATPDEQEPTPYAASELICVESKDWNRVLYGYARKWSKVPWLAYEEHIDKPEAVRLFGQEMADRMQYEPEGAQQEETDHRTTLKDDEQGARKVTRIYQIWDKDGGRKVRYFSEQVGDAWLLVQDDPLQLAGFFNCPRPLQFIQKTHSLVPTALYTLYESQAKELNELTRRIKMIAKAIKAKGIYDGELGDDLKKLLEADDNELVPADKSSSLSAEKGLQNAIWFMPIENLIVVLTQLYQAREACKQVIYEITGISDILRGATQASETATAQTIKNQWGTLRLKRAQKEVARYARDVLRLMLELAASKFSEETWAKMTGLPFLLQPQVAQLQQTMQALQMQPSPQSQQQMQQIQQQLQQPQWTQVLQLLQDDLDRAYRIDIETNSTVEPEATEDQKQIGELFASMGQFLNGVGPLVAQGVMPFQVAQSMLLTITRRFRFGSEIEDLILQMQPPPPPETGAGEAKAKAQEQAMQQQVQAETQKLQLSKQQQDMDLKMKTMEAEKALLEQSVDLQLREIQLKAEQDKFALEKQAATQMLSLKSQADSQKVQGEQKVAALQNGKYKTEQVVSQKADAALGKGVQEMKALVQQLADLVSTQAQGHQEMMLGMTKAITAPRKKKAIRGKDGRIESVEESVA